MPNLVFRRLLCALPLLLPAARAEAVSCTVTPTAAAFANYDPSNPLPTVTTGSIAVNCTALVLATTPYVMSLSSGASGSAGSRTMVNGSGSTLKYQLYLDALYSVPFGDGSGGTSTFSGSLTSVLLNLVEVGSQTTTIYGRIPAGQLSTPGSYSDSLLVTISF